MPEHALADVIKDRLSRAAYRLRAVDPVPALGGMLDRSFPHPVGAAEYEENAFAPGTAPFEPSFSEREAGALRFGMEPLVGASPLTRRNEATLEARRLAGAGFGTGAVRWFDDASEEWRSSVIDGRCRYGAWFGASFDDRGLAATKVYYELAPGQITSLRGPANGLARIALESLPGLLPLFTSIRCGRRGGTQRVTFLHGPPLRLADLSMLMDRLGMAHQLPSVMQVVGLALGGRFELPPGSVMLGLAEGVEGAELKLEILLERLPDVPRGFLDLLALGLAERPRELQALTAWLDAFTPDQADGPGQFSILSIRTTPRTAARVNLYLRPIEFTVSSAAPTAAVAAAV